MAEARVIVAVDTALDDTDEHLSSLVRELALDLRDVGEVDYVAVPPQPDGKGVGEVVAATLAVVTAAEPTYIQALVETVVAFLRRNEGRKAHLRIGDIEITVDQPTSEEVAALIETTRSAVERAAARSTASVTD